MTQLVKNTKRRFEEKLKKLRKVKCLIEGSRRDLPSIRAPRPLVRNLEKKVGYWYDKIVQFNPTIIDHFTNPRNVGEIPNADGVGTVGHPVCGDVVRLYIKIEKKGGEERIQEVKFKTFGGTAAIATSSIATEMIKGKTVKESLAIKNEDVAKALGGLPPIKMHCSVLAHDAIHAAVADYMKNSGQNSLADKVSAENRRHEDKELLSRRK